MTSDTFGPTCATPFASYDPESRCWRTSEATSLWALTLSSLTLPSWGCLLAGELYALPTPALPTVALECSSSPDLLKTPHAGWGERGRDGVYPNPKGQYDLQHQMSDVLLPTPRAQNGEERNAHPWVRPLDQPQNLENAIARIGASTPPPSDTGSPSSDDLHRLPL
jgi:hypothetical protein